MRRFTRRQVLGATTAGVGVAALGVPVVSGLRGAESTGELLRSRLPLPEPFTLPFRRPAVLAPVATDATTDHYRIVQRAADVEILPGVRTRIWGYNGQFPGPTLVSRSGRRTVVRHHNTLPVPVVVHLHGGHTPADHDGYPTDLLLPVGGTATGHHGHTAATGERDYVYPMRQRAATLWYHDHRMDFTGPSVWRGLAGFHLVSDDEEDALPLPRGDRDLPLMITDRAFDADGSLRYPGTFRVPGVEAPYRGGVLGDVMLVNGVPWPLAPVPGARHRLRLLNACNARRLRLRLDPPPRDGSGITQIGADQGLLAAPVRHESVDLAPAERCDVVVDFGQYPAGTDVTLVDDFGDGRTAVVLRFRTTGRADDPSRVPDRLSSTEPLQRTAARITRDLWFRSEPLHGATGWTINGVPFSPDHVHARPRLGETELWRLSTDFHHPIHLHLAAFQVLSRGTGGPGPHDHGWKDTIDLRPFEQAEILVRFDDYPGRYVFHCHNLEHEDMMMMGNVEVRR